MPALGKLRELERLGLIERRAVTGRARARPIEEVVAGDYRSTPLGRVFVCRAEFPFDAALGERSIEQLFAYGDRLPGLWPLLAGRANFAGFDLNRALFFDTETTGLSGGAGTNVFLVGAGYFAAQQFIIEQFFLTELDQEPGLLAAVMDLLGRRNHLVSFNGRAFDWQLLRSRLVLNRLTELEPPVDYHLDLLFSTRRLWKRRLPGCRLYDVERGILGFVRSGLDVPSHLIPVIYSRYLATGDARPLPAVLYHNQMDVLALLGVLLAQLEVVADPEHSPVVDYLPLGRMHEELGNVEVSMRFYEKAHDADHDPVSARRLARLYKRQGRGADAVRLWEELIDGRPGFDPRPFEELAKYHEHQRRDRERACAVCELALRRLERHELYTGRRWPACRERFTHRLARLTHARAQRRESGQR